MNKKQTFAFAMLVMVFGVATSPILSAENVEAARADDIRYALTGDLTAPNNDKPFGGDTVGFFSIGVKDESTTIYAGLESRAPAGMVYEGWLVDVETGEKLSVGIFNEGIQRGFFALDPGFHYDVFVITEEPVLDSNPAPNRAVAGVPLDTPFGQ